jgi:hypothetical protein
MGEKLRKMCMVNIYESFWLMINPFLKVSRMIGFKRRRKTEDIHSLAAIRLVLSILEKTAIASRRAYCTYWHQGEVQKTYISAR